MGGKDADKAEFALMLSRDMDKLSSFHGLLNKFYVRIFSGNKHGLDRKERLAKKMLSDAKTATVECEAPSDDCLPFSEYEDAHGDPELPENKKRGHYVLELGGKKMVAMPKERERGVPWKIKRKFANQLKREDVLEDGNEEEMADDDQADRRFDAEVATMQTDYARATSGSTLAALME